MFAPMMMPMQCGGMNPMMGMFGMFQMFQMLQMLMMLMGQGQQGQCGCQGGYPQGYGDYLGNSFGMPGPVSLTSTMISSPRCLVLTRISFVSARPSSRA